MKLIPINTTRLEAAPPKSARRWTFANLAGPAAVCLILLYAANRGVSPTVGPLEKSTDIASKAGAAAFGPVASVRVVADTNFSPNDAAIEPDMIRLEVASTARNGALSASVLQAVAGLAHDLAAMPGIQRDSIESVAPLMSRPIDAATAVQLRHSLAAASSNTEHLLSKDQTTAILAFTLDATPTQMAAVKAQIQSLVGHYQTPHVRVQMYEGGRAAGRDGGREATALQIASATEKLTSAARLPLWVAPAPPPRERTN